MSEETEEKTITETFTWRVSTGLDVTAEPDSDYSPSVSLRVPRANCSYHVSTALRLAKTLIAAAMIADEKLTFQEIDELPDMIRELRHEATEMVPTPLRPGREAPPDASGRRRLS